MHANRNKKAVKRVEKGMMKANRIRNLFAVFAILTFLLSMKCQKQIADKKLCRKY